MEYLYAPWRSGYFKESQEECIFCQISNQNLDIPNRVFYRDDKIFCVMNKYPYVPGHFLIIPHHHTDTPCDLKEDIWLHLQKFAQKGVGLLNEFGAKGINMGMNIKQVGGAGIPGHIHLHLIPRFFGDTNFFTTIGDCRAYGVDFEEIYWRIKELSLKYFVEN
ncbi:HIT family protein [Helicobacter apodemus]|uniref:HIT family hydrolase n=1 Tax=Helicobacter apodemus TaxID=135569 RepID=A0A2U8FDB7_9HELI|nr:HIT domain-containing protein [Helicobacter apodemus]AWI34250.1 HIT family hydrolase [Helicobacter apodemus]MDE6958862.1 HIT domain-containing protein [Helicobacter apodemus]